MACSLDDEQLAARRAEWQSLAKRRLVQKIDEEGGFTATYRGDDETARVLDSLVQAELECCPDIGWNLERDGEYHVSLFIFPVCLGAGARRFPLLRHGARLELAFAHLARRRSWDAARRILPARSVRI